MPGAGVGYNGRGYKSLLRNHWGTKTFQIHILGYETFKKIFLYFFFKKSQVPSRSFTSTSKFLTGNQTCLLIYPTPYTLLYSPISILVWYSINTPRLYHPIIFRSFSFRQISKQPIAR